MHEMKLKDVYFNLIKNGKKIYEIRLNDEKRKLIKTGDIIVFKNYENPNQFLSTVVKGLNYFESFSNLLNSLSVEQLGFKNQSIKSIENVYHTFYSVEDEKRYGVVAIQVERL